MTRSINFAAGPATLPTEVLERAKAELLDYQNTGMSIMEMSHRGSEFREVLTKAESDFRFTNFSNLARTGTGSQDKEQGTLAPGAAPAAV